MMARESDLYGTTEMQDRLLLMLKDFTAFCRKYHIRYSLCGGTLLGAVRHKGFIPWDDDLDIMVSRQEFKHLLAFSVQMSPAMRARSLRLMYLSSTAARIRIGSENSRFWQFGFYRV